MAKIRSSAEVWLIEKGTEKSAWSHLPTKVPSEDHATRTMTRSR